MSDQPEPTPTADQAPQTSGEPLGAPPDAGNVPVLQKLSAMPFPRSGFPMLGIMASVYEHATTVACRMRDRCRTRGR